MSQSQPAVSPAIQNPMDARLQQYIRWAAPPGVFFAAGLFALYAWSPQPLILVCAVIVTANAIGAAFAYRLAGQGNLRKAIAIQAAGMLAIAFFVGEGGPSYFPFTATLAFLAVVHAIPYVTRTALLTLTSLATAIVLVVGVSLLLGVPDWRVELPPGLTEPVLVVGVASLIVTAAFWLWHARVTLEEAFVRLSTANAALSESERSLDAKVRARTAELENSQVLLAYARDEALRANQHKSGRGSTFGFSIPTPLPIPRGED